MARRRPSVLGKGASINLRQLGGEEEPREWVLAVLSSRSSPDSRYLYSSWTWGEIREAIRQDLERRRKESPENDARLKTNRGLAALRNAGAVEKAPDGRYHLIEEAALAEIHVRRIREIALKTHGRPPWKPSSAKLKKFLSAFPPGWQVDIVRGSDDYGPGYILASFPGREPAGAVAPSRDGRARSAR
jgi:DNA-binding transcriptional ArsR family regulator